MRRTIWSWGLISGAASVVSMFVSNRLIASERMPAADLLGYSSMVLSALLIFFGMRSYRERVGGGRLRFGQGLGVGVRIALVSCACAVIGFELLYFHLAPDFGENFVACMIERAEASGAAPAELEQVEQQARTLKGLYDNPWSNAALTFATTFPVGLVGALLAAAILRRKPPAS